MYTYIYSYIHMYKYIYIHNYLPFRTSQREQFLKLLARDRLRSVVIISNRQISN